MSGFSDIRLVVADLDGTLLDDEKQLDAGIVDVIKELAKREIMFTLASGRNIHIMKHSGISSTGNNGWKGM